jgi:nucleoid-associated protein YgaU
VVDDRTSPVLSTVRPGTAEANVAHPAAATGTGLVRKADGKDYYTVQKDDKGYWGIAAKPFVYGDGRKWDLIQKANPGVEPSKLRAGQELVIPSAPVAAAGTSTTRPAVALTSATRPAGSSAYSVKQNDSLASIAKAKYGVEALWHEIAKANPSVDPAHLRIGQELVLPSAEDARRAAGMSAVATTGPAVAPLSVSPAAPVAPTSRPALARHTSPTPAPDRTRTTATPPARTTGGWD